MGDQFRITFSFFNLGGYHLARLKAVKRALPDWQISVIELAGVDSERPWGAEIADGDIRVMQLFRRSKELDMASRAHVRRRLRQQLSELQPDVVVVPGWGHATARTMLRWARRRGIPTVLMSESKADDKPRNPVVEFVKGLWVRQFDTAIVGGEKHRDYLVALGMSKENIAFGYDVVDNAFFSEQAREARANPQAVLEPYAGLARPFLITATRFIERKNLIALIRGYEAYLDQCPETPMQLMLVGKGEQESAIRQLVTELNLEQQVHLPGFVDYQSIARLYGIAHALIHPALSEQWGLVVNEACSAGLPVLVSETVGAAEMIEHGVSGFLFDPYDVGAITKALIRFHGLGDREREAMGSAAVRTVERYSPEAFGDGIKEALDVLANSRKTRFAPPGTGK